MPRNNNKPEPEVMTWSKAIVPVFIVAGVTDALKFMCEWLVFFGPALAGVYCTIKTGGPGAAQTVCTAAAGAAGFVGAEVLVPLGIILAFAVAFIGWLIVGAWILATNRRIFRANATSFLWFLGSLALGLVPFIDSFPFLTGILWKLYRTQIKVETEAHKKWERETAAARKRQQEQSAAAAAQIQVQAMQQNEMQQEEQEESAEALY